MLLEYTDQCGGFTEHNSDCIAINCHDSFRAAVELQLTDDTQVVHCRDVVKAAFSVGGRYWWCADDASGYRIYVNDDADERIWLFHSDGAWWASPTLDLDNVQDKDDALCRWNDHPVPELSLYCPGPDMLIPFWQSYKKPFQRSQEPPPAEQGPYFDYGPAHFVDARLIATTQNVVAELRGELEDHKAALEEANSGAAAVAEQPATHQDGEHAKSGGAAVHCCELLRALRDGDWDTVEYEKNKCLKMKSFANRIQMTPPICFRRNPSRFGRYRHMLRSLAQRLNTAHWSTHTCLNPTR